MTHFEPTLLQERVPKFGLYGGGLAFVSVVFHTIAEISSGASARTLFGPTYLAHYAAAFVPLLIWAVTRRGAYSERFLRWAEGVGLVTSCLAYAFMGYGIEQMVRASGKTFVSAQFIVLMAMTMMTFARAIFVPSTPRHTLWVTSLAAIGLLALASPLASRCEVDIFGNPALPYLGTMLGVAMWWSMVVALATLASRVIYGLRKEADIARQYGQYTLVDKIGEGGMGVVYRAQHRLLRRPTAVKLLPPERAGARAIERFEREVQLTAQLTHPNTVTIFDYGRTPGGTFYYAMELLDGETLQDIVEATGPMPPSRALHVLVQVAGALVEAHGRGLIHRDIKPANIMLCTQGGIADVAKVLDFGLAQDLRLGGSAAVTTITGLVAGTPQYLAPETLAKPDAMSTPADIYAFGGVAFWLLTGRAVYEGDTIVEVCAKHMHSPVPSVADRCGEVLPNGLDELVAACLAKSPATRPTARELVERLRECMVDTWGEAEAAEWWRENQEQVGQRRRMFLMQAGSTLEVDWARR
jgi:serine/threonine-protein kinase